MVDLLQLASQIGGVGGVLAVLVFLMYRRDRNATEKRLTKLLEGDQESRENNTKALAELTTLIMRLNGRLK